MELMNRYDFSFDKALGYLPVAQLQSFNEHLHKMEPCQLEPPFKKGKLLPTHPLLSAKGTLSLHFPDPRHSSSPSPSSSSSVAYEKRMAHLRLKQEQRNYNSLVSNVAEQKGSRLRPSVKSELNNLSNVTAIALNLAAAPLTVGGFLYFFVCPRAFDKKEIQVIASVLGGVAILFIEMILFVIRSETVVTRESKALKKQR